MTLQFYSLRQLRDGKEGNKWFKTFKLLHLTTVKQKLSFLLHNGYISKTLNIYI